MANYAQSPKIKGYHGTYPENIAGIQTDNFMESTNHNVWLGDGVYFFIDGIGVKSPIEYAQQFAIDQCFNKDTRKFDKSHYVVIEASIKINDNKYLDLTSVLGNQLFNKFRYMVMDTISKGGKVVVGGYNDTDVLKLMRQKLEIEFVKCNVYIKFAVQRRLRFESKIPNVTVLVVNNPTKNIQKMSINAIKNGEIL